MILLDTHSWIWLFGDDPALGPVAREAIALAESQNELYLCPISLWEIGLKQSRGRLDLQMPLRTWLQRAIRLTGVRLTTIGVDVACDCADLPPDFHGDPADRLIAATARAEGFTLITNDGRLLRLAEMGYFNVIAT